MSEVGSSFLIFRGEDYKHVIGRVPACFHIAQHDTAGELESFEQCLPFRQKECCRTILKAILQSYQGSIGGTGDFRYVFHFH
jgi:hypothetical protein